MCSISKVFAIFVMFSSVCVCTESIQEVYKENSTTVTTRNVTAFPGRIVVKEVSQPHNLFIGRCTQKHPVLHQENVVLNNDGQSQVSANIRMNVEGPVHIDCVNIFDEDPDVSAYPSYTSGGIGHNFVEFSVLTTFGKGFKFFVQIFGHRIFD